MGKNNELIRELDNNLKNIQEDLSIQKIYSEAKEYFKSSNLNESLIIFLQILAIQPDELDTNFNAAVIYSHQNVFGSMPGSYPISGGYCTNLLPSWSTKFLADSLMLKLNPQNEFKYLS